jgi:hypothetical protein
MRGRNTLTFNDLKFKKYGEFLLKIRHTKLKF